MRTTKRCPIATVTILVDGQLVERNVSYLSSSVAAAIVSLLRSYALGHSLGNVFGPDLGIRIHPTDALHTRHADIGFIAKARFPRTDTGYLRVAPDLVVEVVSPGDAAQEVRAKASEWLERGVRVVWAAFPEEREIHAYTAGKHPQIHTADDEISAEEVHPGFAIRVSELIPAAASLLGADA